MRPAAGRLGMTVLGIYLIVVGVAPFVLPMGFGGLTALLAIVAGALILLGR